MDRFSNLEFHESQKSNGTQTQNGEPIRDHKYFYKRAMMCWLNGDFEEALRNFSRSLEKNCNFFEGWFGQILMLIELEEYHESITWAGKAIELFPANSDLLAAKAIAHYRDGQTNKAIAFADNAIEREKVSPFAWLARAEIMNNKKSSLAENCISKALITAGDDKGSVYLQAGRILLRYHKYLLAHEYLYKAARAFPKSAMAWYELGRCQSKLRYREAAVSLEQCLILKPNWEPAQKELFKARNSSLLRKIMNIFKA